MKISPLSSLFVAGCFFLLATGASATTWLITPDGSGDAATIQAAIDAATAGDIIELADGVFAGDGNRDLDFLGKAITVRSQGGEAAACIIDCGGSLDDEHRGFDFHSLEGPDARLQDVTVINGYVDAGDPPAAGVGGGILIVGGAAPTLEGVVLRDNTAKSGGGMFVYASVPTISGCEFIDNDAWWGSGGGISMWDAILTAPISDCVFRGNHSHQAGGGLAAARCEFSVEHCVFDGNTLDSGYGGGLDCYMETICEVVDCTFVNNIGDLGGGGAMVWFNSIARFQRCTFVENTAAFGGSGVGAESSVVTLLNSIIAFGTGVSVGAYYESEITLSCCDVYGNSGGDWVDSIADQEGVAGNLSTDPLFCGVDNPDAPYSLRSNSPCAPGHYPCMQIGAWPVGCSPSTTVEGPAPDGPDLVLLGVAPNPFNPRTMVTVSLVRSVRVEVGIYDFRGHRIAVLADGIFAAGDTTVDWDGRDDVGRAMPSGTYLVRVSTAAEVRIRKAVLIR